MTDRGSRSRVAFDGRRIVVDLSDADLTELIRIGARSQAQVPELVLAWIRRGLGGGRWGEPGPLPGRLARDVEVAQQAETLFGDLLGSRDSPR